MRKLFLTIICAACMVSLCGCRNETADNSSDSSQSSSQSAVSSSSSSVSSSQSSSQSSDNNSSGNVSDSEPTESEKMAEKALNADEWPSMESVTEQDFVDALFSEKIVLADCEDYSMASNVISAQLYKLLIVKPKAEKADEIQKAMDEYFDYVKTESAFYPDQEASAAGAVKGKTDSGYIYIIVHPNGQSIADEMLS